ncbi:hypothetical protein BJ912DRAFT_1047551 [Pholiota molesta]|nr:hypothetical protein BJ912DRAFT_1047551 [Pholiota molesta]
MPPQKRKRPRSPAEASRIPRWPVTDPHPSVRGDAQYGDAQPRPGSSALPARSAEWPAQATGGSSTSRQHDHPRANEDSEEEPWAMASLQSDHLRAARQQIRDHAMGGSSTSRLDHHRHHPPAPEDEDGAMASLQWDHLRAARQEIKDHDRAIAGHATSRRDHRRHPPTTNKKVTLMAPSQWHLPRAAHYSVETPRTMNGSTQGWNRETTLRSGSAVGAGRITNTADERVEPSQASTTPLMGSRAGLQMTRTEDGQPEQEMATELYSAGLLCTHGGRIYRDLPSPQSARVERDAQPDL